MLVVSYNLFVMKKFKFLKRLGFKFKSYYDSREKCVSVHFIKKKHIEIVIDDRFFGFGIEIGPGLDYGRGAWRSFDFVVTNIYDLGEMLGREALDELKTNEKNSHGDKELITLYADFLSANIGKLMDFAQEYINANYRR